jgi:hypothetical protein
MFCVVYLKVTSCNFHANNIHIDVGLLEDTVFIISPEVRGSMFLPNAGQHSAVTTQKAKVDIFTALTTSNLIIHIVVSAGRKFNSHGT